MSGTGVRDRDDAVASRRTLLVLLLQAALEPDAPPPPRGRALTAAARALAVWAADPAPPGPDPLHGLDPDALPVEPAVAEAVRQRLRWLGPALRRWADAGVRAIGARDDAYPRRLRRRLGKDAPPLLFAHGDPRLPGRGGVLLRAGPEGEHALPPLCRALDRAGLNAIRFGADGIAIERGAGAEGAWLGIGPPDRPCVDPALLQRCGFALADAAVLAGVRREDPGWPGCVEAIARDAVPVWAVPGCGDATLLLRAGARLLPPELVERDGAAALLRPQPGRRSGVAVQPARPVGIAPVPSGFAEAQAGFGNGTPARGAGGVRLRLVGGTARPRPAPAPDAAPGAAPDAAPDAAPGAPTLFELFRDRLLRLLSHGPLGAGRIASAMELCREQAELWLARAAQQGVVRFDPDTALFHAGGAARGDPPRH